MNLSRFVGVGFCRVAIVGIFVFCLLFMSAACGEKYETSNNIKLLTKEAWVMDSYVDYSKNVEIKIAPEWYVFDVDGSFVKIKESDTISGSWSMIDNHYMSINGQSFRIADLTRRIMVLRYGQVDFVYKKSK